MNRNQRRLLVVALSLILLAVYMFQSSTWVRCDWDNAVVESLEKWPGSDFKFCSRHYKMAQAIHDGLR